MDTDTIDIAMLVGMAVVTVAKWLVYTCLLWGMIKIQKLNFNVLGLFGSSLAATLVAFIPYVGSYLSYAVLIFCLWKCTGAEIAPDIIFTVGIAGALMFCVNLFVIGALMGDIRSDLTAEAREDFDSIEMTDSDTGAGEVEEDWEPSTETPATIKRTAMSPVPVIADPKLIKMRPNPGTLVLKGVTLNPNRSFALISDGSRIHTVSSGESFTATLTKGREKLICAEVTKSSATLKSEQGERILLRLP